MKVIIVFVFCFFLIQHQMASANGTTAVNFQKSKPVKDIEGRFGEFEGKVVTEWLADGGDDRRMRLLEDFSFIDSDSMKWVVSKNTIIDGASIPRVFWTFFGSPYVGDYRKASVIHDYYCQVKTTPYKKVHRMFYEASLASGVPEVKAKAMYAAIWVGGPRWEITELRGKDQVLINTFTAVYDESKFLKLMDWINDDNPSIGEIEERLDRIVLDIKAAKQ